MILMYGAAAAAFREVAGGDHPEELGNGPPAGRGVSSDCIVSIAGEIIIQGRGGARRRLLWRRCMLQHSARD
jgi:hypothetical protein